jgi:phosphate-selective porin OprO/OprP
MAEYAQDTHRLNLATTGRNASKSFTDTGFFTQVDYWLTGEKAGWNFVKPLHPFNPEDVLDDGWGAWEIAARFSNVHADTSQFNLGFANPGASAKTTNEYAIGLNWTLNNNLKYDFDYAYSDFYGGAGSATSPKDRPQEEVLESQLQVAF